MTTKPMNEFSTNLWVTWKKCTPAPRGGYRSYLGYSDSDVIAEHVHLVWDSRWLTSAGAPNFKEYCLEMAKNKWVKVFPGLPLGEVCIRAMYYPRQVAKNLGTHTDFCALSVPIYDSADFDRRDAFYGEAVSRFSIADFAGKKPLPHSFKPSAKVDRLYVVAFCQLPMEMVDYNGQRYGDLITELCKAGNDRATATY